MNRQRLSVDTIVQIYILDRQGLSPHQISNHLKVSYPSVLSALKHVDKYLSGKASKQQRLSRNYRQAVAIIREQNLQAVKPITSDMLTPLQMRDVN